MTISNWRLIESMQHFNQFELVCKFFIMSNLDPKYEQRMDIEYRSGEVSAEVESTVHAVKSFHEMRQELARCVYNHVTNHDVLNDMIRAQKVEQYHTTPPGSTCALTNEKINDGILCVLYIQNQMKLFSAHKDLSVYYTHSGFLFTFQSKLYLTLENG